MTSKNPSDPGKNLVRADPSTIRGKFLVGYQGWFTCPGDGPTLVQGNEWAHWTDNDGQFNAELLPDPEYYSPEDLVVMPRAQHKLFSSRNPAIVRRHMNIMAMHGIDGLFVTRRGNEIAAAYQSGGTGIGLMKLRSEGINTVFRAAEAEGRVVSMMYDLNGLPSHQIEAWVAGDWDFMLQSKHVIESPAYVREHGQPVVALWSVGFKHAGQDPEMIMRLINRIREMAGGAYIILGVPITWQKQDQNWQAVYSVADAIAPICIGTLVDEEGINNYSKDVQHPGVQALKSAQHKTDYVGVVWPGNEGELTNNTGMSTSPAPRNDGAFFWRQVYNAHKDGQVFNVFSSICAQLIMFSAFEEGTAILPSLGAQNDNTPSDWYLRICSYASEALKGEKRLYEEFPRKELFEYWSTRPHYEEHQDQVSAGGSSSGNQASASVTSAVPTPAPPPVRTHTRNMTADFGDAPPPYSLEADAAPAPASGAFTTEPESIPSGPVNPAPAQTSTPYQSAPFPATERPPVSRVDSVHSVGSHGSYHGQQQQHRPDPIAVPGAVPIAAAVQYTGHGLAGPPSGFPGGSASPMPGVGGVSSSPPMQSRPPQHPSAASRPPNTTGRPPSRPGRPSSASSSPQPPLGTFPSPGGSGVHHITTQMGAMGMGPNRPAPEHVFAGVGQARPQMTGAPSSPFEGVHFPGRFGTQDSGSGLFGQPSSSIPPTPSSGGIPGSPFYPAPLQGGGPHSSPGPVHQHSPGPAHQNTLAGSPHPMSPPPGPHHQNTIGPGQHAHSPHHQNSLGLGPHHQSTIGPSPHHQNTLEGSSQPPQPSFQAHQPYVPSGPAGRPSGSGQGQYHGGQYTPGGQHSGGSTPHTHPGPSGSHPSHPNSPYNHPQTPGSHPQAGYNPAAGGSGQYPPPGPHGQVAQPQSQGQAGHIQQMGQAQHPQWSTVPGGQYIDSALGTIGKLAGEDKKKKLEQGIGSAFTAGTKLWGKFNK
ncbi:putative GH99-GH71-like-2 protein [Rhizoctonia solani 123E]|uniref:Putative GH99-GH71-like-2 protein n=1 Tax=Rhizoctonia solani 123E TaxID=1423351 RepID=A0A074S2T9_9AGAM|nr:putative GH99-GH71-like-2 protein [Rhizoctonia solani 123E]